MSAGKKRMSPVRKRAIGAVSVATVFSATWMAGPALLPFSDLTAMHVTVGLLGPYGVAGLFLALVHKQLEAAEQRVAWPPTPPVTRVRRTEAAR